MRSRFHMSLWVRDLEQSVDFYGRLFQMTPTKLRDGYAKFEVADPSLNLSLNQGTRDAARGTLSHFGIQVYDRVDLESRHELCKQAGMGIRIENQTTCCHALQDKFWVNDPDGNEIEIFLVLDPDVVARPEDVFRGAAPVLEECCDG